MSTDTITPLWTDEETLNLAGVDENAKDDLVPKGTYSAYVDESTFGDSAAGNPMVTIKFKLESDEEKEINGRVLWMRCTLNNEFGLKLLKKAAVALNPEIDFQAFKPADVGSYFEGQRCTVKVDIRKRKDTGEFTNEVKDVLPATTDSFWGA